MSRTRAWCLTCFTTDRPVFPNSVYSIVGEEKCPKTGRMHWQCYVYYKHAKRFTTLKKAFPTAHLSPAKGSPLENQKYCSKDGKFKERGKLPLAGRRTDIHDFIDQALALEPLNVAMIQDFPAQFVKYHKAYDRAYATAASEAKTHHPVETHVLWGAAGSGKTRKAFDDHPDLFMVHSEGMWWDGYAGQDCILFDDFYGGIKYSKMLTLLDRYQFRLATKGSFAWKSWKTIIITSNQPPGQWYKKGLTPALQRRLTTVSHLSSPPWTPDPAYNSSQEDPAEAETQPYEYEDLVGE